MLLHLHLHLKMDILKMVKCTGNAATYPEEFIEAIKNSFGLDISGLPITKVGRRRRVSSDSLGI